MLACEVISRPTKKQFDVPSAELTLVKGVISVEAETFRKDLAIVWVSQKEEKIQRILDLTRLEHHFTE